MVRKIGIDLGSVNTLVTVPGKGIVINEPSVVAVQSEDNSIAAIGSEAKIMIGRTPEGLVAVRPIKEGVIANYRVTEALIRSVIKRVMGPIRLLRPEVMIAVPVGITSTERRAITEAALNAGAKAAYIVKEPVVAA